MNPSSEVSFCHLPCDLDLANFSEPHFSIGGGRVCIFYMRIQGQGILSLAPGHRSRG